MQTVPYDTTYRPARLLDAIRQLRGLRNDIELAAYLDVDGSLISKVRRGCRPVSGGLLLRIHEVTAIDIGDIKNMIGDRRQKQRFGRPELVLKNSTNQVHDLTARQRGVSPRKRA